MKRTVIALLLAVIVAGCSGKKDDAPAAPATCKVAVTNALAIMKAKMIADAERETGDKMDDTMKNLVWGLQAEKAGLPLEHDKQVETLESLCVKRGDSPDARNCVARAKSMDDITACQTKYMEK